MLSRHFGDVLKQLTIIDSKVGDLNVRVNIAEVRLEERKPQALLPAPTIVKRRRRQKPKEA